MQILDGLVPLVVAVFHVAPAERSRDVQPQSVVRNGDCSGTLKLVLVPQLAAQVDVPFDLILNPAEVPLVYFFAWPRSRGEHV